jgi:hypothetical protein
MLRSVWQENAVNYLIRTEGGPNVIQEIMTPMTNLRRKASRIYFALERKHSSNKKKDFKPR